MAAVLICISLTPVSIFADEICNTYATHMSYCDNGGCWNNSGSCSYSEADHNIYCCTIPDSTACVDSGTTAAVSTRTYSGNCTGHWWDNYYSCTPYNVGAWSTPTTTTLTMTVSC